MTGTTQESSWGPPGGGREPVDGNRFTAGQREFYEETGFPWQAILNHSRVKCFTWYLLEEGGLDNSGDRWVLLLPHTPEEVNTIMELNRYHATSGKRETLNLGWIAFSDILGTTFPLDPKQPQPMLPITTVVGPTTVGPLRPKYAIDTQLVCAIIQRRVASGTMSYCAIEKQIEQLKVS